MRKSRGREETRFGQAAFTGHLPSKYIEMRCFYTPLTFFTCALPDDTIPKNYLIFFAQSTCAFVKSLLESLSIATEHLSPKTRRVWTNGATHAPLDKSVGSLNRSVGRSPKRPTNAFDAQRARRHPAEVPYRTERMAGSKETWVANSPLMRKAEPLPREK